VTDGVNEIPDLYAWVGVVDGTEMVIGGQTPDGNTQPLVHHDARSLGELRGELEANGTGHPIALVRFTRAEVLITSGGPRTVLDHSADDHGKQCGCDAHGAAGEALNKRDDVLGAVKAEIGDRDIDVILIMHDNQARLAAFLTIARY
jgi:hypothetical protein